ncbi:MAG: hypothetical protein PWP62_2256 [Eubacteriaceae bacterium]|jgi:hypothetical protein|nr:hypothetical protein [Eubacteriaceae bacterium]
MKKKLILATTLVLMLATAGTTMAAGHGGESGRHGNGSGVRQEQCLQDGSGLQDGTGNQYGGGNGSGDGVCDGTGSGNGNGVCDGSCLV